ncbi:folylpolyglutamate synthase [Pelomyxa schiedti]|nr:folylpolyglutamate synthase [Pelomyxa schiedti]
MSGHGVEMLTSFRECVVFLEQAIKSCVSRDGNSRWTHRYEEITKRNGGSQPHPMILLGDYLEALSVSQQHLSDLHVIHVTGTKGKGSTCAFVESILRAHGYKTGLFTSPHLLSFTERFRIGGTPVSEDVFAAYLHRTVQLYEAAGLPQPPTFALLSLMCWYMFVSEKVDVAVIEVGIGGDFDFTNVVNLPAVCAFSSIGHDHMDLLGDTLQSIAFHKAGIMRPRIPAFSTEQLPEAMTALQHYADTLPTQLSVVRKLDIDTISTSMGQSFVLGLRGDFQLLNSALAVAVSREWLHQRGCTDSAWSPQITRALATCKWPGRAQLVKVITSTMALTLISEVSPPKYILLH